MNKFKTVPKITFNESQYTKKFPSNFDENENRARRKGGEVNSRKEMESKISLYFQKKIKFLISKYKNIGGLQLFEMEKTKI